MYRTIVPILVFCAIFVIARAAHAGFVDFEALQGGGPPTDNSPLSTVPYIVDGVAVSFGIDTTGNGLADTDAVIEEIGANAPDGFSSSTAGGPLLTDIADPTFGDRLGNFFLRHPVTGALPDPLIITYSSPPMFPPLTVTEASGEIWDIDGRSSGHFEQWRVEAYDSSGILLATIDSPQGEGPSEVAPLDGRPWTFQFKEDQFPGLAAGIRQIRISFIGNITIEEGIGLAFDNFSPVTAVPEPSSIALAAFGFLALAWGWRRRKR